MSKSPPKDLARTFKTRWSGIFKKAAELHDIDERVRISIIVEKDGVTPIVFSTEEAGHEWPPHIEQYTTKYLPIIKRPSDYLTLKEMLLKGRVVKVPRPSSPTPPPREHIASSSRLPTKLPAPPAPPVNSLLTATPPVRPLSTDHSMSTANPPDYTVFGATPPVESLSTATPPVTFATFRPSTPDNPTMNYAMKTAQYSAMKRRDSEVSFDDELWATSSILSSRTGSPSISTWSRTASPLPTPFTYPLLPTKRMRLE